MSTLPQRFPAKKVSSRRLARIAEQARAAHTSHTSHSSHGTQETAPDSRPISPKAKFPSLNWLEVAAVAAMLVLGVLLLGQYLPRSQRMPESTADGSGPRKVQVGEDGAEKPPAPKPVEPPPAPKEDPLPVPKVAPKSLEEKLKIHVSFELLDTPIHEALAFLSKHTGAEIFAVAETLKGMPPIHLKVTDMEAELALQWMVRLADMDFEKKDGLVVVRQKRTPATADVELRIYDIAEIVRELPPDSAAKLPAFLRAKTPPQSWEANQGAALEARGGKLVVLQREAVHQSIHNLLSALRANLKQFEVFRQQEQEQESVLRDLRQTPPDQAVKRPVGATVPEAAGALMLIAQLGTEEYEAREAAEKKLLAANFTLLPTLLTALGSAKDPEVKTRLERVVKALEEKRAAAEFLTIGARDGSIWGLRQGEQRAAALKRYGGSPATEGAVESALRWLASHQEADGHWDSVKWGGKQADTSITALALLAMLGAGHSEIEGKYKENVKRAVAWLRGIQREDGCLYQQGETHSIGYHHGIAGLALVEAADMGSVPATVQAAQRALEYSISKHQHEAGGWRYNAKQKGSISVSAWFIQQLKAAKVAGLKVDPAAFEGAIKFLDSVEAKGDPKDPQSGHRYGYTEPTSLGHRRTAMGCYCRQILGWKREDLQGGVHWWVGKGGLPEWGGNGGSVDLIYWYYGTLCTFQQGGEVWKRWNEALKKALVDNQRKGGDEDGSWDPVGVYADYWGRTGQTAFSALCLEVYYRYPRLYKE